MALGISQRNGNIGQTSVLLASALMAGLGRTSFDLPRATGSDGTALRVAGWALDDGGAGLRGPLRRGNG